MSASSHAIKYNPVALLKTEELQMAAAAADASVWVAASAGTGKTKVLTDRILRLLLAGAKPEEILCLTYTKAAAAEMTGRLVQRLTEWVVMPLDQLAKRLRDIGLPEPEKYEQDARGLFAKVLDCPGGLRIQTVHSFCQSILARFPLESGLSPNFEVLGDVDAAELQTAAFDYVVTSKDTGIIAALKTLQATVGEFNLREVLFEGEVPQVDDVALAAALHVDAGKSAEGYRRQAGMAGDHAALRRLAEVWISSNVDKHVSRGNKLADYLASDETAQLRNCHSYIKLFFTTEGENYTIGGICNKEMRAKLPELFDIYLTEAERLRDIQISINRAEIYALTRAYATLRRAINDRYSALKRMRAVVDYDDLIQSTLRLLANSQQVGWVMYKLDSSINHVLVDEAQDTSEAQWRIVRALTNEFLSGEGAKGSNERTLFVVGDEKQTIYAFNGADPEGFARERGHYHQRFKDAGQKLRDISLLYSFRSVSAVLDTVNAVFASALLRSGVSLDEVNHQPARANDCGEVEVWPLVVKQKKITTEGWQLPFDRAVQTDANITLARDIATRIADWLHRKAILASSDRPVTAGDIMILVRKRGTFAQQIVRALKEKHIPVAGVDKLRLSEQLAVQDVLALMNFVLLPNDDLNLAALLKSPFIHMSEEDLFDLCYGRTGPLWLRVQQSKHGEIKDFLYKTLSRAHERPYTFIERALTESCPASVVSARYNFRARMGDEVIDPLNELLAAALTFEADHVPALQRFVKYLADADIERKRELSQAAGEVRVMTVHASKGLQAPIVFLADAAAQPNIKIPRVLGDARHNDAPLFYVPSSSYKTPEVQARREAYEEKALEEHRRLLYVAMTRAEDRLIVCGTVNSEATNLESHKNWYAAIAGAVQQLGERDGDVFIYRKHNAPLSMAKPVAAKAETPISLPEWAKTPIKSPPSPAKPLAPSKAADAVGRSMSPVAGGENAMQRFAAGLITHKLLEVLPDIPPSRCEDVMDRICAQHADEVPAERMATIKREVVSILNDAEFAPLFGPNSMAEVPLTALVNKVAISGQIDRLLVTDTDVFIVDYKTNRPPPQDVKDVETAYLVQLACYVAALRNIYGNKEIRCALLWTDGPRLMKIPTELLLPHLP